MLLTIVVIIAGAVSGTLRTYMMHDLKLITPTINIRGKTIAIKLGFLASTLIGAIIPFLIMTGIYQIETMIPVPSNVYEAGFFGIIIGYSSLDIANRLFKRFFKQEMPHDLDMHEFTVEFQEINITKVVLLKKLTDTIKCIERVKIIDNKRGGLAEVVVVPTPGCDAQETKKTVERFFAQWAPMGTIIIVRLPEEIAIDIQLTAVVLDYSEKSKEWYKTQITQNIKNYVNSLLPGQWVKKQKILFAAMDVDRQFISNILSSPKLIVNPEIGEDETDVVIGEFQVARARDIWVNIVITPNEENGF